jgi:hypothetical protein
MLVPINRIKARIVSGTGLKVIGLEDSPHYAFLSGQEQPYIDYLKIANQPDHSVEKFKTLIAEFDKVRAGYILCDKQKDEYIIHDGFHRACILAHQGASHLKVGLKDSCTVVLALRGGGDFNFFDMELLAHHLRLKYGNGNLTVIGMIDGIDEEFELNNITLVPTPNKRWKGWWTKMNLFSPEMEKYRPFLYLDLDTAVVGCFKKIIPKGQDRDDFIMLEDFYRKNHAASGMMWIPKHNEKVDLIWKTWISSPDSFPILYRGDQEFIGGITKPDQFWQNRTSLIESFKPRYLKRPKTQWLRNLPLNKSIICFHGNPRIRAAAKAVDWVNKYVQKKYER